MGLGWARALPGESWGSAEPTVPNPGGGAWRLPGRRGAGRCFGREPGLSAAGGQACVVLRAMALLHPFLLSQRSGQFRVMGGARGSPERGLQGPHPGRRAAPRGQGPPAPPGGSGKAGKRKEQEGVSGDPRCLRQHPQRRMGKRGRASSWVLLGSGVRLCMSWMDPPRILHPAVSPPPPRSLRGFGPPLPVGWGYHWGLSLQTGGPLGCGMAWAFLLHHHVGWFFLDFSITPARSFTGGEGFSRFSSAEVCPVQGELGGTAQPGRAEVGEVACYWEVGVDVC